MPLAKGLMVDVSESEAVIDSLLEQVVTINVLDVMMAVTCVCDVMDVTCSLPDPRHVRRDEGDGDDPGPGHSGRGVLVIVISVES